MNPMIKQIINKIVNNFLPSQKKKIKEDKISFKNTGIKI